jgi:hypothetical protein
MVVRGDEGGRGGGDGGTRHKGHVAPLPPLPRLYLPALVCTPMLTLCSFVPRTHLSPSCLFVPPMFICTPCAHLVLICPTHTCLYPCFHCRPYRRHCCRCSYYWCLICHLSPPASWFMRTRWFAFVFAFIGHGSNSPPLLAGSWFVFAFAFTFVGPGSNWSPLLLAGLLVRVHWLVHICIRCRCCCWRCGCCCCHGCSHCTWVLCLTPPGIGLGSPKGGEDNVVSINFYVSE